MLKIAPGTSWLLTRLKCQGQGNQVLPSLRLPQKGADRQSGSMPHLASFTPLEKREEYGAFHTLVKNQLREDEDKFYNYFKMQKTTFDSLLQKLSQKLKHQDTILRQSISPAERLAVTLR
ncbi:hypothetical protein ACJJTC_019669 [Scirpophaga incertulas]